MSPTFVALAGSIGTVIAGILALYGIKNTVKWAIKAQAKSATTVAQDALLSTIDALTKDVVGVRKAQAEDRRENRKEIAELRTRVGVMEVQRTALTSYIRRLLSLIREDGRLVPPPLPPGMTIDED